MKKITLTSICTFFAAFAINAQTANEILGTNTSETEGVFTTGASITTGDFNVLIGDGAGGSLSSGGGNTFLGTAAGAHQTSAYDNVFIGRFAGYFNSSGTDNVFIGTEAGRLNTTATDNVFIGTEAGENNTAGYDNVFIGEEAGTNNIDGDDNVFIGEDAGFNNTTADDNTFVGNTSGRSNTTGYRNAFFGSFSGYDNSTGYRNTFVGDSTGVDVGIGRLNTFVGQAAGSATEYANYNTFIGSNAGGDNNRTNSTTNANRNTYVGVFAGFSNREGEDNVGMGAFADYSTGGYNIINITGRSGAITTTNNRSRTTFIGAQAFANNDDVVAVGYKSRTDGLGSIAIGSESKALGNASIAIGNLVNVTNPNTMALGGKFASNRVSVGIGTEDANLNASLELADVDKGFLINRVNTAQRTAMITTNGSGNTLTTTDEGLMVYDTDLDSLFIWDGSQWVTSNNTDEQDLTSASLTGTVLTVAIENGASVNIDLAPILSDLQTENANQQAQINDLLTRVATLESCACGGTLAVPNNEGTVNKSGAMLYQNIPNPFNGSTAIKYYVPHHKKNASIIFSNNLGQVINTIPLKKMGEQELFFNSNSLAAGLYYYTLFVDGKKIDTKKMVIQ